AEERPQVELTAASVAADARIGIELVDEQAGLAFPQTEAVIQRRREAAAERKAVGADTDLVDPNGQRLAGPRVADLDPPHERVPVVELLVPRLEPPTFAQVPGRRLRAPSGIERRERDRVAGVDRQRRRQVTREVPVQGAPLEWDLVQHG